MDRAPSERGQVVPLWLAAAVLAGGGVMSSCTRVPRGEPADRAPAASSAIPPVAPPLAQLVARLETDPNAWHLAIGPHDEVFVSVGSRILLAHRAGPPSVLAELPPSELGGIQSLVADGADVLYAARGGDVLRFSIPEGTRLAVTPARPPGMCARTLAAEPSGTLLVLTNCSEGILQLPDEKPVGMVRLAPTGGRLAGWRCCEGDEAIAVDASGAIDWARPFSEYVVSATADGQFAFDIGGRDDPSVVFPGGTRALAADRKGHLFVLDADDGVDIVDALGPARGPLRGRFGPGSEKPPRRGARALAIGPSGDAYVLLQSGIVERYEIRL
jgi:hypothetical protein